MPVEDVVAEVLAATRQAAAGDARCADWDWSRERRDVERMAFDFINKNVGDSPELAELLPEPLLSQWRERATAGDRFLCVKYSGVGGGRFVIYSRKAKDAEPTDGSAEHGANKEEANEPKRYRFPLIAFRDMKPGLEPAYLVDELVPSAGLVLVWGKQKTFKSFWLLDLCLHIAMGWTYRERAVRQGTVLYCAFEGAHGFKGRTEALRRHYCLPGDTAVPLYVMPGQADLIKERKQLVGEFKEQLGDTVPILVVLDTLNRSLVGSESKDVDMTNYTRAAEEVRDAFKCVVIVVHHCGYDDTHARGHTSLPAAVDAELATERGELSPILEVIVKHMRDGAEGTVVRSRAITVPLDPDQGGKERASIVIVPEDTPEISRPGKQGGRPDAVTPKWHEALFAALNAHGEAFRTDQGIRVRAVAEEHIREQFYRRFVHGEEDKEKAANAKRMAFKRSAQRLMSAGVIDSQNDNRGRALYWLRVEEGAP
jgi:hypothetical protein